MSNPGGRIWVDPEGVVRVGDAYGEQVELYHNYLTKLADLRLRYADAWGDDEMGTEFSTKFLAGLDNLEKLIGGVKGTLEYTSQGLVGSGRLYRTVDDEAGDVSDRLARDFESGLVLHSTPAPVEGEAEATALRPAAFSALLPAENTPAEPLEPLQEHIRPVEPIEPFAGTPLTSMHLQTLDFADARINGEPLPEGYQLVGLVPLGDGTTRVDANRYESITPLGGTVVTGADGLPIDAGKTHLFVVKYDDTVDPAADGYQPLYVGYTADGTPIPLITGDE